MNTNNRLKELRKSTEFVICRGNAKDGDMNWCYAVYDDGDLVRINMQGTTHQMIGQSFAYSSMPKCVWEKLVQKDKESADKEE
jgi:isocitrate lyase